MALALAAIGIYGVMAYSVVQRKHEVAIRVALGASPGNILRLVVRQGLVLIVVGVALGVAGSLALTRFFAAILFQVSARDPFTLAGVGGLLIAVGLLACYFPACHAMTADPIAACARSDRPSSSPRRHRLRGPAVVIYARLGWTDFRGPPRPRPGGGWQ